MSVSSKEAITTENSYLVTWTVQPGEFGMRLDHFLKTKYRRLSREYLQGAIKRARVTLNKAPTKASRLLREGDKVYVHSERGKEPAVDFNYKVIYEDSELLIIDKPGNLPVHPTGRYFFNTLLMQLRVVNNTEVDQNKDFFLVHRIDRETSGLLAIGKTSAAAAKLVTQFEDRKTEKEYLAIVRGVIDKDEQTIDVALGPAHQSNIRVKMGVVAMGGDGKPLYLPESEVLPAKTIIQVIERAARYTLVRCKPHTGRQHQIRVHLDHIGHPICGDKLYGATESLFLDNIKKATDVEVEPGLFLSRHALHAHRLSLFHPKTKEKMSFESSLPEELAKFWQQVASVAAAK